MCSAKRAGYAGFLFFSIMKTKRIIYDFTREIAGKIIPGYQNMVSEAILTYKRIDQPSEAFAIKKINKSIDAVNYLRRYCYVDGIYNPSDVERFGALLLNRANVILSHAWISHGTTTGTVVDVSILMQYAVMLRCSGIIIFHNHPSGNTRPSEQDIALTKQITNAAKLFNIDLCDHIIITEDSYTSMSDDGIVT